MARVEWRVSGVNREDVKELYYVTPLNNLRSILDLGILSHERASGIVHDTFADCNVQDRRKKRIMPGGRALHSYANLYFSARNPMLYRLVRVGRREVCVVGVSDEVLDTPGVIIADRNASSDYAAFAWGPQGLSAVDRELVFAESWTDAEDRQNEFRLKSIKCAEVLVPDMVHPDYITDVYVPDRLTAIRIHEMGVVVSTTLDPYMFFREG